jgi:hypothetical protein
MTATNSGILVGCLEDVYSKEQTGSDILIAVTLRQRSKTDMINASKLSATIQGPEQGDDAPAR